MNNIYEIVRKLKNDLLNATRDDFSIDKWISDSDIHKIRIFLRTEKQKNLDLIEKFNFIESCLNFESIYCYYFFESSYNNNNPESEIRETFDPLIIYLMDNNFEVTIKKINPTENISIFRNDLIQCMQELEEAYAQGQLARVSTLSSTLMQNVFKTICDYERIAYSKNDNYNSLYSKVKNKLKLNPADYDENQSDLRKFCSKLNEIIIAINELRNIYSDSHGSDVKTTFKFEKLPKHHIKLLIDSTKTVTNFIINTYEYQKDKINI